MRPPTITMMRLAKRNTTSMSCSMKSTVSSRDKPEMTANSSALSSFGTPAAVGAQQPGEEIDERGLAGAVRPDQRIAHARRQLERDVLRHHQRAEALIEVFCGEHSVRPGCRSAGT